MEITTLDSINDKKNSQIRYPLISSKRAQRGEQGADFDEVDDDDVQDLLESHAESLSNDELIDQDKASQLAEKEGNEEEPVRGLDIKTHRECLGGIKKGLETLKERDPNPARSSKVAHDVEKSVKIYQEIKTHRECLGGIKKGLETLKEHDPNPARSSKVAHDVEKSVKIYQEIYDEKT
ncbi:hypothetical protein E2C01_073611 [Portunus trituberculatus]|uniref:Uncharacterized protein n=1 Tax=Portunus trituberculatus TaxID=210409 RepID=A0A5B7IDZ0_PORTR|nr:hypothetical protein [Portunus trituberculatus]